MSNLWSLNWNDVIKGLISAVIGGIILTVQSTFMDGMNWKIILSGGIASGLAYLIHALGMDQNGKTLGKI